MPPTHRFPLRALFAWLLLCGCQVAAPPQTPPVEPTTAQTPPRRYRFQAKNEPLSEAVLRIEKILGLPVVMM